MKHETSLQSNDDKMASVLTEAGKISCALSVYVVGTARCAMAGAVDDTSTVMCTVRMRSFADLNPHEREREREREREIK